MNNGFFNKKLKNFFLTKKNNQKKSSKAYKWYNKLS